MANWDKQKPYVYKVNTDLSGGCSRGFWNANSTFRHIRRHHGG